MKITSYLKVLGAAAVVLLFVAIASLSPALGTTGSSDGPVHACLLQRSVRNITIPFIENAGQLEDRTVRFYARQASGTLYVTDQGRMVYPIPGGHFTETVSEMKIAAVRGEDPSPVKASLFRGSDPSQWKTTLPVYNQISLGEIYRGVELRLTTAPGSVEKVFTVAPGANPQDILLVVEGAEEALLMESGELRFAGPTGNLAFSKPLAYQEIDGRRIAVPAAYYLPPPEPPAASSGHRYGFSLGHYDRAYPLVIDPLFAATFIGEDSEDSGEAIALDSKGNVFVAGTMGIKKLQDQDDMQNDVFVAKLNSDLTQLLGYAVLEGSGTDAATSMVIDGDDNVVVAGATWALGFPTTPGAYQSTKSKYWDTIGFIAKLSNDLTELLASTYYADEDGAFTGDHAVTTLRLDGKGGIYAAGSCYGWPGCNRSFVARFTGDLTERSARTVIPGVGKIALDPDGNVFFGGHVSTYGCLTVQKYDADLAGPMASFPFLNNSGGCACSVGGALAVDAWGNVYITGGADWSLRVPREAYYGYGAGGGFRFVAKLDNSLTKILSATLVPCDTGVGGDISLDGYGNVYLAGWSEATGGSSVPSWTGTVFVRKLDTHLTLLLYGEDVTRKAFWNRGKAIVLDNAGNAYVAGLTTAPDFPVTEGAYDTSFEGSLDAFVAGYSIFTPGEFTSSDYFPLRPGTTWTYKRSGKDPVTYQVMERKVKVGDVEAYVLRVIETGEEQHITNDGNGIVFHGDVVKDYLPPLGYNLGTIRSQYNPPMRLTEGPGEIGQNFASRGVAARKYAGRGDQLDYSSHVSVRNFESVSVPAGEFPVLSIAQRLVLEDWRETNEYYLARHIGPVLMTKDGGGRYSSMKLISTNALDHDLAVTAITVPATATLSKTRPAKTITVTVTIQNRSPFQQAIPNGAALKNLVTLLVESLGACPAPVPVLKTDRVKFPILLKSKQTLKVNFDVLLTCANDPAKSTSTQSHADYRFKASVNCAALEGMEDVHPDDDWCPRTVTPPSQVDPYPDGTIEDKGCGTKKPDGTLGGEVVVDVVK